MSADKYPSILSQQMETFVHSPFSTAEKDIEENKHNMLLQKKRHIEF